MLYLYQILPANGKMSSRNLLSLVFVDFENHKRRRGMRGLEVGIALVDRIALPIIVQRVDLVRLVGHDAHDGHSSLARADHAIFVDVVPIVEDEIEAFDGDLPIRREVPVFIALASSHAEANLCHRRSCRWKRPRPPHLAALTADRLN